MASMLWIHTAWRDLEHITKFKDTHCRWYFYSPKTRKARGVRIGAVGVSVRNQELGRKPYMDGSNWGIMPRRKIRVTRKGIAVERPIRQERKIRGKKV